MMTGAVITAIVHQPLVAIPLAFLSHFVLDSLPHFGVEEGDIKRRNSHPLFRTVLALDLVILSVALIVVPLLFHLGVPWWVVLLGMIAGWLPDAVWIRHFWRDRRGRINQPNWLTRFHQRIQWFERPQGIITEIIWLVGTAVTVFVLAA
jgi:hypothetical protein